MKVMFSVKFTSKFLNTIVIKRLEQALLNFVSHDKKILEDNPEKTIIFVGIIIFYNFKLW